MKSSMKLLVFAAFVMLLIFFMGCNEGSELANSENMNSEYDLSESDSGTLNFFITATQLSGTSNLVYGKAGTKEDILSLIVTISELEVHRTSDGDAGWKILPLAAERFDLIELDGSIWADLISSANPEPGEYNKIRVEVTEAVVRTDSGTFSALAPGDKIKIKTPFNVKKDGTTEITLAFDPKASLKSTGNKSNTKYFLNPVLKVTSKVED
ncbi:MAG: DUF4382 domain-containing protein [Acidobacteriota bacterium]